LCVCVCVWWQRDVRDDGAAVGFFYTHLFLLPFLYLFLLVSLWFLFFCCLFLLLVMMASAQRVMSCASCYGAVSVAYDVY
jgi:hypothetical protein